jgi:hypothetical protein
MAGIIAHTVGVIAAAGVGFSGDQIREVTIDGSLGSNSNAHGYGQAPAVVGGSINNDSLGSAKIILLQDLNVTPDDFRVQLQPGNLPVDFFSEIVIQHSGGTTSLFTASVDSHVNNTGDGTVTQWRWDNPPTMWVAGDNGLTYDVTFKP